MPNENHDPKNGQFAAGGGDPYLSEERLQGRINSFGRSSDHGPNHGEPRQHPAAAANAHSVNAGLIASQQEWMNSRGSTKPGEPATLEGYVKRYGDAEKGAGAFKNDQMVLRDLYRNKR